MPKRAREDELKRGSKRVKATSDVIKPTEKKPLVEVDFPRGGGSSFTPLETKAIHAEAAKEVKDEIFRDSQSAKSKTQKRKRASLKTSTSQAVAKEADKDRIRVEHLNYKRITVGQRLLCQITYIHPLALIVSLPNQLMGHIPITHISPLFTERLERLQKDQNEDDAEDDAEGGEDNAPSEVPDLQDLFQVGQFVSAVVTEVRAAGARGSTDLSRSRDESVKASRRVELTVSPDKVNAGVAKLDLRTGFNISAVVKSVEDHGYITDMGIPTVSGFLSLKEARKGPSGERPLVVGQVISTSVTKMSENGRTVTLSVDASTIRAASVSEVAAVTSVLPGALVQGLITAVLPWGLNVQILGFFGGTLDLFHLTTTDVEAKYKIGQKIKARVLWDVTSNSPRTFSLSTLPHIISLSAPKLDAKQTVQDAYPLGTILNSIKITRVETEWGLLCEVAKGASGFVHISHVSDEHVPSLSESSGLWKVGSTHRARVIGFSAIDGLLQLSLKPSIIDQKFLCASDVQVGEVIKGTVKSLSEVGLFVAISENVDGVVWPLHFSDIKLKHPERKFKVGNSVKCRVFSVDTEQNRISLTLKKTLVESDLPVVAQFSDASIGLVTHGVIAKLFPKSVLVNYYGGIRAFVPMREATEENVQSAEGLFTIGQVVRTRITAVDVETSRITASIRQGAPNYVPPIKVIDIELGSISSGAVVEVQKDNIAVTLSPSNVRALLSINNLANKRGVTSSQLRSELHVGDSLPDLVTISRNPEKNFVIVSAGVGKANTLSTSQSDTGVAHIDIKTLKAGDIVSGRMVNHHGRQGSTVRVTKSIVGHLHPVDTSDDFSQTPPFAALNSVVRAAVLEIDQNQKRLVLSTRPSRLSDQSKTTIIDPEITSLEALKPGMRVRGFIKSVADHGLFVSIGRGIDARVQIRELFDEYVKEWKDRFTVSQVVEGRIARVDQEKNQVELTFRSGDISQPTAGIALSDLSIGENVDAVVKKVETYGLFIEIKGSKISGLCHKSELSDSKKGNVSRALTFFKEGDPVRARVLSVDLEKRRVNFGLKPSYFVNDQPADNEQEDEVLQSEDDGSDADVNEEDAKGDDGDDEEADDGVHEDGIDMEALNASDAVASEDVDSDEGEDVVMEDPQPAKSSSKAIVPALQLGGFKWGHQTEPDSQSVPPSSDDEDGDDDGAQTKSRKKRRKHEIAKDMTTDMHTKTPESTADFERLLLGSPNSSFLWLQYMSFQLQLSEVDKAREIGRRALNAINFREEQEKLNVWIALLNLENSYGTDESLEAVFKDATRHTDSKGMHLRLCGILDQTGKHEKAEELHKRTSKKFGQSSKVWTVFGEHYLNRGLVEEARKLLPRSLQSLDKRKHLKTISKFAQLEYKQGDAERGKTIFEGIIDSHPKRLDLWSVYMDMEAGQKNIQSLRYIFDRALSQKLSSKKAKFFFKKWLALERSIGDEEGANAVVARATAWAQGGNEP